MTIFLSDQELKRRGNPATGSPPQRGRATEIGGKVSRLFFTKTLPAADLAIGDRIELCALPPDTTVVGGLFSWSRGQGAAMTAIGSADTPGKYRAAARTASAAAVRFAETQAQHHQAVVTAEELLVATNGAAAWIAGSTLRGFVEYIGA